MSKTLNLDELLNMLGIANSSSEKAAIIAETVFADMPELTAIIARRCIVLHWFDQSILSALLSDLSVSNEYARNLYQQLSELPFVERINFGLTYHSLTREGLLKNYVNAQSDLLIKSCTLAAPQYGKQYDNSSFLREALFCYILAGNTSIALELLDRLLIHSASRSDWQSLSIALQIQDEAEKFHFVSPIPRYAHHWLARAISYYEQGDFKASLECYEYAWKVNKDFGTIPQNREVVDKNFQTWKNFF